MNRPKKFPLPKPVKVEVDIDEVSNLATEKTTLPQIDAWNKEIVTSLSECTSSRDVKTFLITLKKYVKLLKKDYTKCWDRVLFIKSIQRHVMAMGDFFSAHAENVKYEFDYVFYITKIIGLYCTLELEVHRNAFSQVNGKCDFVTSVTNRLLGLMFVSLNFTSGRVSDVLLRIEYSRTNKFHSAVMTRLYHHCLLAIPLETTNYAAFYSYYLNFQDMQELTPRHLRAEQKKYLLQSFGKSQEEVKDDLILKKILETPARSAVKTVEHIAFPRKRTTRSYFKYLQTTQTCHVPNDRNITDMMVSVGISREDDCTKTQNTFNFVDSLLSSSESESESEHENIVCEIDIDSDFEEITYIKKQPPKRKERHKKKHSRRDNVNPRKPAITSNEVIVLDSSDEEEEVTPPPPVNVSIFGNDNYTSTTFNHIEYTALTADFTSPEFHHGLVTPPRERCGLFEDNHVIAEDCEEQGIFASYNDRSGFDSEAREEQEPLNAMGVENSMDTTELNEVDPPEESYPLASIGIELREGAQNEIVQSERSRSTERIDEETDESEKCQSEVVQTERNHSSDTMDMENNMDTELRMSERIDEEIGESEGIQSEVVQSERSPLEMHQFEIVQTEVKESETPSETRNDEGTVGSFENVGIIKVASISSIQENTSEIVIYEETTVSSNKELNVNDDYNRSEASEKDIHKNGELITNDNSLIENVEPVDDTRFLIVSNNITPNERILIENNICDENSMELLDHNSEVVVEGTDKTNESLDEFDEQELIPSKIFENINETEDVEMTAAVNEEPITADKVAQIIFGNQSSFTLTTNESTVNNDLIEPFITAVDDQESPQNIEHLLENRNEIHDDNTRINRNVVQIETDFDSTSEESYTITGGNDSHSELIDSREIPNSKDLEDVLWTNDNVNNKPKVLYTSTVEAFNQFEAKIHQSDEMSQFSESYSEIDAFLSGPIENSRLNDQFYGDNDLPAGDLFALANNGLKGVLPSVAIKANNKLKKDNSVSKPKKVTFSHDIAPEPVFDSPLLEVVEKRGESPTPSPVFEKWRKQYSGEFKKVLKDINNAADTGGFSQFEDAGVRGRRLLQDDAPRSVTFSDHVQLKFIPPRPVSNSFVFRNGVKCFVNRTEAKVFWDAAVELHLLTPAELRKHSVRVPLEHNTRTTCLLEKHEFRKSEKAARAPKEVNPALRYSGRAESYDESCSSNERIADDLTCIPCIPNDIESSNKIPINPIINTSDCLDSRYNFNKNGDEIQDNISNNSDNISSKEDVIAEMEEFCYTTSVESTDKYKKETEVQQPLTKVILPATENQLRIDNVEVREIISTEQILKEPVDNCDHLILHDVDNIQSELIIGTISVEEIVTTEQEENLEEEVVLEEEVTLEKDSVSTEPYQNEFQSTQGNWEHQNNIEEEINEEEDFTVQQEINIDEEDHLQQEINRQQLNVQEEINAPQELSIQQEIDVESDINIQPQFQSEQQINTEQNINSIAEEQINLDQEIIIQQATLEENHGNVEIEENRGNVDTEENHGNIDTEENRGNIDIEENRETKEQQKNQATHKQLENTEIAEITQNTNDVDVEVNSTIQNEFEPYQSTKTLFETIHEIAISLTSKETDRNTKLKTLTKLLSTIISRENSTDKEDNPTVKDNKLDNSTTTTNPIPLQAIAIQTDSNCTTVANEETRDSGVASNIPLQAIAIQTESTTLSTNEDVNSTKVANIVGDKLILDMSKFNNTEFDVQAIKDAVNMKNAKFNEEAVVKVLVEISSAKNQLSAEPLEEDLIECLSGDNNKQKNSEMGDVDNLGKVTEDNILNSESTGNMIIEGVTEKVQDLQIPENTSGLKAKTKTKHNVLLNKNTNISKVKINEKSKKSHTKTKEALKQNDKPLYNINKLHDTLMKRNIITQHDKPLEEENNKRTCLKYLFGDSDDETEIFVAKGTTKINTQSEANSYEKYQSSLKTYDENCLVKAIQENKQKKIDHFDVNNFKTMFEKNMMMYKDVDNKITTNEEELKGHHSKKINTHKQRVEETQVDREFECKSPDESKYKHIYNKFGDLLPIEQPSVKLVDYLASKKENISAPKDSVFKTVLGKDKLKHQKHKTKHLHKPPKFEKNHHKHERKPESLATLSRNSLKSLKARRKSTEKIEEMEYKSDHMNSQQSVLSPYTFNETNEKMFALLIDYRNENIMELKKELKSRRKSTEQKDLVTKEIYDTSDTETADESVISVATCISVKKQQCLNQVYNKNRHKSTETRILDLPNIQDGQKSKRKTSQGSRKRRKINEDPLYRGGISVQQVSKVCPYGTRQHWDLREYTLNEVIDIGRKGVLGPLESEPSNITTDIERTSEIRNPDKELSNNSTGNEAEVDNNSKSDTLENVDEITETIGYEPEDNLVHKENITENREFSSATFSNIEENFGDIQVDVEPTYDDDSSRDLVICSDESQMSDGENSLDKTNLFNLNNVTNDETNISPLLFNSNCYLSDQPTTKPTTETELLCPEIESSNHEDLQVDNPVILPPTISPSFAHDLIKAVEKNNATTLNNVQDSKETETEDRMDALDETEPCFDNQFINRLPNPEIQENTHDNLVERFERDVHDLKRKWDYEDDDNIYWTLVKDKYMLPPKKRCRVSSANNQTIVESNYPVTQQDLTNTSNEGTENVHNVNLNKKQHLTVTNIRELTNQQHEYLGQPYRIQQSTVCSSRSNVTVPSIPEDKSSRKPLFLNSNNIPPHPIMNSNDSIRSHKLNEIEHSRVYYPMNRRSATITSSKIVDGSTTCVNYDSDSVLNYKCSSTSSQLPSYNQIFGKCNVINNFEHSTHSVQPSAPSVQPTTPLKPSISVQPSSAQPASSTQSSTNETNRTIDMEDPIQIMDDGSYKISLTEEKVLRGEVNSMLRSEKNACYIMAVLTGNKDNVACPFDFEEAEDMKVANFDTVCNYVLSVITQEFFQNCYNKSYDDTTHRKKSSNLSENGSYTAVKGLNCASAMIYRRLLVKCLRRLRPVFKTPAERKQMPHQLLPPRAPPPSTSQPPSGEYRPLTSEPRPLSIQSRPLPMEPPPPYTPSLALPPPTPLPQNIVVKFINPFIHPAQPSYTVPEIHVKLETSNVEEQTGGTGTRRRNCTTFRIT